VSSNPARGMDVCFCVALYSVGRGICDGLITHPEESYRVSNSASLRNLNEEAKARFGLLSHWMDGKHNNCRTRWPRGLRHMSWQLGYWDRDFESRSGHGCFFLCICIVLSSVGLGICDGLINGPKE
jgi:hypothetical protein